MPPSDKPPPKRPLDRKPGESLGEWIARLPKDGKLEVLPSASTAKTATEKPIKEASDEAKQPCKPNQIVSSTGKKRLLQWYREHTAKGTFPVRRNLTSLVIRIVPRKREESKIEGVEPDTTAKPEFDYANLPPRLPGENDLQYIARTFPKGSRIVGVEFPTTPGNASRVKRAEPLYEYQKSLYAIEKQSDIILGELHGASDAEHARGETNVEKFYDDARNKFEAAGGDLSKTRIPINGLDAVNLSEYLMKQAARMKFQKDGLESLLLGKLRNPNYTELKSAYKELETATGEHLGVFPRHHDVAEQIFSAHAKREHERQMQLKNLSSPADLTTKGSKLMTDENINILHSPIGKVLPLIPRTVERLIRGIILSYWGTLSVVLLIVLLIVFRYSLVLGGPSHSQPFVLDRWTGNVHMVNVEDLRTYETDQK